MMKYGIKKLKKTIKRTHHQMESKENELHNNNALVASLPMDIVEGICSYLTINEIVTFKQITSTLHATINNSPHFNQLIEPYLQRLKTLDSRISLSEPVAEKKLTWQYPLFTQHFQKIQKLQWDQITEIIKNSDSDKTFDKSIVDTLKEYKTPASLLNDLETRNTFLANLIRKSIASSHIKPQTRRLHSKKEIISAKPPTPKKKSLFKVWSK